MKIRTVTAAIALAGFIMAAHSGSAGAQPATAAAQQSVQVTVARGDSLAKIAQAHQTTYVRLFDANAHIAHPDVIHPGWVVRVPSAAEQLARRQMPSEVFKPDLPVIPVRPVAAHATPARQTVAAAAPAAADGSVWDRLAQCESSGKWSINTGNGYRGGLQFSDATWKGFGGTQYAAFAHLASREQQIDVAKRVLAKQGWNAWPACSAKLGLR
jgi:LysM repeat protein